jgi:hypothetical protein
VVEAALRAGSPARADRRAIREGSIFEASDEEASVVDPLVSGSFAADMTGWRVRTTCVSPRGSKDASSPRRSRNVEREEWRASTAVFCGDAERNQ